MIDERATFLKYNYKSTDLKPQSHKKVVAICNDCGKERESDKCDYRDLCKSCSHINNHHSKETINKMSKSKIGKNNPHWKGGKRKAQIRMAVKRRNFLNNNPIFLNEPFEGSDGHHINSKFIIFIPKKLHQSISHSLINNIRMNKINHLAVEYLCTRFII